MQHKYAQMLVDFQKCPLKNNSVNLLKFLFFISDFQSCLRRSNFQYISFICIKYTVQFSIWFFFLSFEFFYIFCQCAKLLFNQIIVGCRVIKWTEVYIEKCQLLFQLASNLLSFIKKK